MRTPKVGDFFASAFRNLEIVEVFEFEFRFIAGGKLGPRIRFDEVVEVRPGLWDLPETEQDRAAAKARD